MRGFGTCWPSPDDHQAAAEIADSQGGKRPGNKKKIEATLDFVQVLRDRVRWRVTHASTAAKWKGI